MLVHVYLGARAYALEAQEYAFPFEFCRAVILLSVIGFALIKAVIAALHIVVVGCGAG